MEKGYFQPASSASFENDSRAMDFEITAEEAERVPLPNQVPAAAQVPIELLKSSTVQSLISQNEDLSARLNVALRRLMLLENDNDTLKKANQGFQTQFAAFSDQIMIWKEKEKMWRGKSESLEQQLTELRRRFPELERMEESIERYRKYHEKVKTQVKPFIQGLKSYAESLGHEVKALHREIEQKDSRIHDLEIELGEQREEMEHRLRSELEKQVLIVQGYEKSRDQLVEKLRDQQAQLARSDFELQDLARLKIREDELENMTIALGRQNEEQTRSLAAEIAETRVQLKETQRQLEEKREELRRFRERAETAEKRAQSDAITIEDQQVQLESQRRLWTQQGQALEQMKASRDALERVNRELSHQLGERKDRGNS